MKIAVTATGNTPNSEVDQRFGRAAYFVMVDTEIGVFDALENSNVSAASGAGINAAKVVIDAGAEAVLTGNCGPNAERTLRSGGVKLYTGVSGKVSDAIEAFEAGKLAPSNGPSVESHFGANG